MKRGRSDSGTHHLFNGVDVRRSRERGPATALCGNYTHAGTFTEVIEPVEDLVDVCENCMAAVED